MHALLKHIQGKDHVIWDWNGTLLSDVPHAIDTINTLLAPRGLPLMTLERYRGTFCFPIRKYYEAIGFDLKAEPLEDLCELYVEAFMKKVAQCGLIPGARELLQQLKGAGRLQSVLSASHQPDLDRMVADFSLGSCFDFVFGIEGRLGASKVARGHDLMKVSGVGRERTVLIGDTDHDLEVAHDLGISAVLVTHGHQSAERLRRVHDNVVDIQADMQADIRVDVPVDVQAESGV